VIVTLTTSCDGGRLGDGRVAGRRW